MEKWRELLIELLVSGRRMGIERPEMAAILRDFAGRIEKTDLLALAIVARLEEPCKPA